MRRWRRGLSGRHARRRRLGGRRYGHALRRNLHRLKLLAVARELAARSLIHRGTGHQGHAGLWVHPMVGLRIIALT